MKLSLGSLYIFVALFFVPLFGDDFNYKISSDKKEVYQKEVVVLKIEFEQTNPNIVLFYDFDLKKSNDYDFKRVEAIESDTNHNSKATYTYLLYPLKDGDVEISFDMIKKVTTDESLAYSFSGDRDNVKGLSTKDTKITLNPLKLKVKPIPADTIIVGDFKLEYNFKTNQGKSYEPIVAQIKIDGAGYPPKFKEFPIKEDGFKIFRDTPIVDVKNLKTDIKSTTIYPIAFSSDKTFKLDEINIKAFNPKTNSSYFLTIDKQIFDIKSVDKNELIDKTDEPKVIKEYLSDIKKTLQNFLSYLFVFLTGVLSGYLFKFNKKTIIKVKNSQDIVSDAKDEKELLNLLISIDANKFKEAITLLEDAIYKDKKVDFKGLKKEVLKLL